MAVRLQDPIVNCATPVEQGSYLDIHNKLKALYAIPGSPFYGLTGDKIDPMRVAYIEALTPYSDKNANPQLIASLQNDPNYKALGFVTKNCKAGDYIVDGEPHRQFARNLLNLRSQPRQALPRKNSRRNMTTLNPAVTVILILKIRFP